MPVSSICNYNVATIDEHADIREAALLMREVHVGDLVVTKQHGERPVPVGMITDRDIVVGVVAKGIDPTEIRVGDAIGTELLTVREDNGIEFALSEMRRVGVRRVPVINADSKLIGVLSVDDVIDHLAKQLGDIAGAIRLEQDVEAKRRV